MRSGVSFVTLFALRSGVAFVTFFALRSGVAFVTFFALRSGISFVTFLALRSGIFFVSLFALRSGVAFYLTYERKIFVSDIADIKVAVFDFYFVNRLYFCVRRTTEQTKHHRNRHKKSRSFNE